MEMRGIDPRTSRMLSERSTIWATSPWLVLLTRFVYFNVLFTCHTHVEHPFWILKCLSTVAKHTNMMRKLLLQASALRRLSTAHSLPSLLTSSSRRCSSSSSSKTTSPQPPITSLEHLDDGPSQATSKISIDRSALYNPPGATHSLQFYISWSRLVALKCRIKSWNWDILGKMKMCIFYTNQTDWWAFFNF